MHPAEDRGLTIRECAHIQTLPDDFVFLGTVSEQAQMVGNATPPLLAAVVARALRESLEGSRPREGNGALLSFVPTLSSGKSPALEEVTRMVRCTFQAAGQVRERLQRDCRRRFASL